MAIIYGRSDAEIEILSRAPDSVENIEDIEPKGIELKNEFLYKKKYFFNNLPTKIKKEEEKLDEIKNDEKKTILKYDEKIKVLKEEKTKGGFSSFSASLKIGFAKHYSKRKEINKIKELEEKQKDQITLWKEKPDEIFNNSQRDTINEIKHFDRVRKDPMLAGAKGEKLVLKKLSELSDDYHVFCGVRAELPYTVRYDGKKNLRKAQLDFIVISKKGAVLIEVKNWSDKYVNSQSPWRAHEQVDKAGKVLWIVIKSRWSWWRGKNPPVKNVLLSIQGNLRYNPNYKFVSVCNLDSINDFIKNRKDELSDRGVRKLIGLFKDEVSDWD